MESGILAKKSYIFLYTYEFLGCMMFLVGINCSQNQAEVCAISLFIAATLTGRICGGHFNMAVTFAVYLVQGKWRRNLSLAIKIILVDLAGSIAAMLISMLLLGPKGTFTLEPPEDRQTSNWLFYTFTVELLFTFVLVSTVLFVKYRGVSSTNDGMLQNMTVALSLFICIRMAGPLSGGGLNPTFALAIIGSDAVVHAFDPTANGVHPLFLIAYILGPLTGGALAAGLLKLTMKISPQYEDDTKSQDAQTNEEEIEYSETINADYVQTEGGRNFSVNMKASLHHQKRQLSGVNTLMKDYLM